MTAVGRPAVMAPTAPTIAEQLEAAPRRFEAGRDEAILGCGSRGRKAAVCLGGSLPLRVRRLGAHWRGGRCRAAPDTPGQPGDLHH